jgi:divalent metal cation (Fe/Co/Zn/Cd) transporter
MNKEYFSRSWVFHAVFSSYLSIIAGIVETVLSIIAGSKDASMSLYSVALMSSTDIIGGVLILTIWQNRKLDSQFVDKFEREEIRAGEKLVDLWYTFTIGMFMLIMGFFLMFDSIRMLFNEAKTKSSDEDIGLGASGLGLFCGLFLAIYKQKVGYELDSLTITAGINQY